MKPVMQSKLYIEDGIHNGNCTATCLASLLEIPLWMVPPFEDMFVRDDWGERRDEWLKRIFNMQLHRFEGDVVDHKLLPEFYIANGRSSRGVYHSVIYSAARLVHDPHPSQEGIVSVEWVWCLQPKKRIINAV